jgi:hypothetical protein
MPGSHDDGWDTFDFSAWGAEPSDGDTSSANGHQRARDEDKDEDDYVDVPRSRPQGKWVSQGGVLNWEEPEGTADDAQPDIRAEAESVWAADDVDLPAGAPDAARVRAARAWLAKQRQYEVDALGMLLVERREIYGGDELEASASRRPHEDNPLDLALAEHQAAVEEYETMLAALEDVVAHNGPARTLVEFYLWLGERLAQLAQEPEAPAGFAASMLLAPMEDEESAEPGRPAPTPRASAEWQGRAEAVTQARRRVERVTAPDPEE